MNAVFDSNVHPLYSVMAFICALIVCIIYYGSSKSIMPKSTRHKMIYAWIIFFCMQDSIWGLFASWVWRSDTLLYVSSYVFHISAILSPIFWTVYFLSRVDIDRRWKKFYLMVTSLLTVIQFGMLFANIFTKYMFYVDDHGFYTTTPYRSIMFYMQFITYIIMAVITLYAYFMYESGTNKNTLFALSLVTLSPIGFGIFQMIYPDAPYDSVGFAVGCVVIHCFLSIEYEHQIYTLEELKKNLDEALQSAKSANKAKSTFLFNMSHDIRTPMNAIIGYTNLAQDHLEDTEKIKEYLVKIGQSSEHLLSLINDVLDMSRIDSGKVKINQGKEDLTEIMDTLCNIVQPDVESRQIEFVMDVDIEDRIVICDRLRLNQVLLNVVSNAIKYTDIGGKVAVHVEEEPLRDSAAAKYKFIISDNGMGMSDEFLSTIYEPFTRVQSSTVSGIQGTGLGMSITKSIVDMMRGTIDIDSMEGEGTKVTLEFEFKLGYDLGVDGQSLSRKKEYSFTGKKILLVEDNEMNLEIAEEILKDAGFEVDTANDGTVAVEKMKNAVPGQYDLILMDVQMPIMNGYDATKAIRKLPNKKIANIPIFAMTANAFDEDRKEAMDAGMNEHITKPLDIMSFKKILSRYLSQPD